MNNNVTKKSDPQQLISEDRLNMVWTRKIANLKIYKGKIEKIDKIKGPAWDNTI